METQAYQAAARYERQTPVYLLPNLKQVMSEVVARHALLYAPTLEQPLLEVVQVNNE